MPLTISLHLVHLHWSTPFVDWGFTSVSRSTNSLSFTTFLLHFLHPKYHHPSSSWIAMIVPTITEAVFYIQNFISIDSLHELELNHFVCIMFYLFNIQKLDNIFYRVFIEKIILCWEFRPSRNLRCCVLRWFRILPCKQPTTYSISVMRNLYVWTIWISKTIYFSYLKR